MIVLGKTTLIWSTTDSPPVKTPPPARPWSSTPPIERAKTPPPTQPSSHMPPIQNLLREKTTPATAAPAQPSLRTPPIQKTSAQPSSHSPPIQDVGRGQKSSPLPPRIARLGSGAASEIATSTAALEAAMALERKRKAPESDDEESEDEAPLSGYPMSRPMANPPKRYVADGGGAAESSSSGGGGRGRGGGRGARGFRGRGRGGGGGRGRATVAGGSGAVDEAEAENGPGEQNAVEVVGAAPAKKKPGRPRKQQVTEEPQASTVTDEGSGISWSRGPLRFHQTYDDDGNVISLPLDAPLPASMAGLFSGREGMGDEQATRRGGATNRGGMNRGGGATRGGKKKKGHNLAGDGFVVTLPRLPGAPMPPVPQLGLPRVTRDRRPPRDANAAEELLTRRLEKSKEENAAKAKGKGKEKEVAVGSKRKAQENEAPEPSRASKR